MIDPKELDRRVTVEQRQQGKDAIGQPIETWEPVASIGKAGTVWAAIRAISGKEFLAAEASQSQVQFRIITRYFEGVTAAMRIVQGSTIYNIEAVLPQGRDWLFLMCSTGLNQG